jgi:hypothetical protein
VSPCRVSGRQALIGNWEAAKSRGVHELIEGAYDPVESNTGYVFRPRNCPHVKPGNDDDRFPAGEVGADSFDDAALAGTKSSEKRDRLAVLRQQLHQTRRNGALAEKRHFAT